MSDDPTADPVDDLDAWVADYRQVRRPSPARRAAIRAAIADAAELEELRSRRNRRLGVGLLVAAGLGAALLLGRLLEHRSIRPDESVEEPGIAPYSATVGQEHAPLERELASHGPSLGDPARQVHSPSTEPDPIAPTRLNTSPQTEPDATEPIQPAQPLPASQREATGSRREPRRNDGASPHDPPRPPLDEIESMRILREAERRLEAAPAASLGLLRQHARRFPASSLKLEREALTVIALCRTGRSTAGRRRQQAFLAAHGASAYASRVRRACPSPTPASPTPASPSPDGRTSHSN